MIVASAVFRRRAPEGDFRDWTEIKDWASRIARELTVRILTILPGVTRRARHRTS